MWYWIQKQIQAKFHKHQVSIISVDLGVLHINGSSPGMSSEKRNAFPDVAFVLTVITLLTNQMKDLTKKKQCADIHLRKIFADKSYLGLQRTRAINSFQPHWTVRTFCFCQIESKVFHRPDIQNKPRCSLRFSSSGNATCQQICRLVSVVIS